MDNIIRDLISVKMVICLFFLKDIVYIYLLWRVHQNTRRLKICKVNAKEAIRREFQKKNKERGK